MIFSTNQVLKNKSIFAIAMCLLIGLIWFCSFVIFRQAPEWDNMEELVWANSFELGYQKHPPLPTWLLYPLTLIFGRQMWLTICLGLLCVVICQWITYHLYRRIALNSGLKNIHEVALLGILTSSFLIYFTIRGGDYNHNSMQLWSIAAMYYSYYRTWEQERSLSNSQHYWWWALLGLITGLAILSKYSVLIQISLLIFHFFVSARWKNLRAWKGLGIGVIFSLFIALPHLLWLYDQTMHGQGPIYYVSQAMQIPATFWQRLSELFRDFLLTQIFRILPCCVFVGYLYWLYKKSQLTEVNKNPSANWWEQIRQDDKIFLMMLALGPALFAMLIGIIFDQKIEAKWAVTFFISIGFASWAYGNQYLKMDCIAKAVILGHFIFALLFGVFSGPGASYLGKQGRGNFPSEELAKVIQQRWQEHPELTNGEPIRFIVGDTWIIGNLIIHDPIDKGRQMKPWIDGNDLLSPWMKDKDKQQVALILIDHVPKVEGKWWRAGHPPSPEVQKMFDQATIKGVESIPWTMKKDAPPLEIQWAILPYKP